MIFIDSNIPMYIVGNAHPHKTEAQVIAERVVASGERLVTDAEVIQEILHRYVAIKRRDAIGAAIQVLLGMVDDVIAIDKKDAMRAAEIVQSAAISARDAVHIAVMERHNIQSIFSFDADFDRWPGLQRIH